MLNTDQLEELQYYLEGTCQTVSEAMAHFDFGLFDMAEIESQLLDQPHPIEECKECGWWFECCELARENEEDVGYCHDCRPEED